MFQALLLRDLAGALHIRDLESTNIGDANLPESGRRRYEPTSAGIITFGTDYPVVSVWSPLVTSARWRFEPDGDREAIII